MNQTNRPYNILLLMADQMHKYALGALTPYVKTPNLDRLAQRSTLFTNAYSNNPVCGPFRALLYSGRFSHQNGVCRNEQALCEHEQTLAKELGTAGYDTSFVGKLHLGATGNGPVPERFWAGHRRFLGYQCYNGFYRDVCFYDEQGKERRFAQHRTDVTAQLGIERLRTLVQQGAPFLHTVFFQAPHYPLQPAPEYEALYDQADIPMPEAFTNATEPYTPTYSPQSAQPVALCPDFQRYGSSWRAYWKLYYAMVTQLDANIGRILDELERLGAADSTAVVVSSDHGDMQGSHGMKNKCLPYERSCGIPLILSVPGMRHIARIDTPVSAVDIYPTCLELAGLPVNERLSGTSLLALAEGDTNMHPPVYAENYEARVPWCMLRDGAYKLVVDLQTRKPTMLFHLEADPEETENLLKRPQHQERCRMMYEQLLQILPQSLSQEYA